MSDRTSRSRTDPSDLFAEMVLVLLGEWPTAPRLTEGKVYRFADLPPWNFNDNDGSDDE